MGGAIGLCADRGQVELYALGAEDRVVVCLSLEAAAQLATDLLEAVVTERDK